MSDHYLTSAQADGLACVMCSADFVTAEVASRPVGRSETGSQVFACTAYCAETYAIITSLSDEEAAYIARRMQERLDAEAGPATAAVLARAGVEVAGNFGDVTGV
ncbi:MAG TPA: hypothetical protein VH333_12560, partial [Pseudonocardiaceae bacterium]|nr:hypothetical protein [Pseudonocardiaceae bacterium]